MTFYYCGQCRLLRRCLDGHFVCGKDTHVIDYNPDIIRTGCSDPPDELLAELAES